jgi:hypothetical protein
MDEGIKHILLAGGVYSNSTGNRKTMYINATDNKVHEYVNETECTDIQLYHAPFFFQLILRINSKIFHDFIMIGLAECRKIQFPHPKSPLFTK